MNAWTSDADSPAMTPESADDDTTRIEVTIERGVAWISLDGARTRNALDSASATRLVQAFELADEDRSVGVVVIRGAHGTFCSGAARSSLAGLRSSPSHAAYEGLGALYAAFQRAGRLGVPSIAVIEGAAVGAGLNLAMATDLRIATRDARLVSGFAPLGIHPGGGHLHLLARSGGRQSAAALGMFGDRLSGQRAKEVGLVWDAVESARLRQVVDSLTRPLASDPELARALKASLRLTASADEAWAAAVEIERARQLWSLTRPPRAATPEAGTDLGRDEMSAR